MQFADFLRIDVRTRHNAVRCRVGLNDLSGASVQARALAQAAAGARLPALEDACRTLCRALAPGGSGGAIGVHRSLKALDRSVAELARPCGISAPSHWHTPIRSL